MPSADPFLDEEERDSLSPDSFASPETSQFLVDVPNNHVSSTTMGNDDGGVVMVSNSNKTSIPRTLSEEKYSIFKQNQELVIKLVRIKPKKKPTGVRWVFSGKRKNGLTTKRVSKSVSFKLPLETEPEEKAQENKDANVKTCSSPAFGSENSNLLECVVGDSVFSPNSCRLHLNEYEDDDPDELSPPCLTIELTRAVLPHLRSLWPKVSRCQRWSIDDVVRFVRMIPVDGGVDESEKLARKFYCQRIDGQAFLLLKLTDLYKRMKIKLGPAMKIYSSILCLKHAIAKRRMK